MARPTGRLTFFFSDVEGSTRLLMMLGERYAGPHGEHQRIVRAAIAAHGGIEVSTEGDSFFAVFGGADDGVVAAAAIQRDLAAHGWPDGAVFRVRIGLHTGQAVIVGDDYVGIDVNRAARIANAANGGQTVLSNAVRMAVGSELPAGLAFRDLGRHRLKDVGVERLWQLDVVGLPDGSRPLRSLEAHPTNLPVERTALIGREIEAAALAELVATLPLVTVTGPGGIGKSRLAIAGARSLIDRFPDGVFYVDLAAHEHIGSLVTELALISETRVAPEADPTEAVVARFVGRSALLVFDTADRLPGFAALASRLIDECTDLRVLVTARAPLHLAAEREFPLSSLPVPGPRESDVDAIAASPAVQLFVRRARAVRHELVLSPDNARTVAAIVDRLDGLPLAIELAAARSRILAPEAILARLDRRLPILQGGAVDAPHRQRTIHATIAWSYEALEPDEQTMLQRLSVFAGVFDLEAALAVAADPDPLPGSADPADILERLVDRSLVATVARGDATDLRLLGLIREFAMEALGAGPDADRVRERHARHWLSVAQGAADALDGPGERHALERLDRADDEFRAALDWALGQRPRIDAEDDHLAMELTCALGRAWYLRGRAREASDYLERALAADTGAPAELRAFALHWSGVMHDERRELGRALERFEASLALVRDLGDPRLVARELNSVGVVARNSGDTDRAAALLEESLAIRRRLGDVPGIATTLTNLGLVALDRRRNDEAVAILEEALRLDRSSGGSGVVAFSTAALGTALLRTGRRDEALTLILTGLSTFTELGDADGVAECLERLGEATLDDDPARAARLLSAASEIRRREMVPLRPPDEADAGRLMDAVEARLDAAALDAARADAAAMDLEAATAYALAGTNASLR